jgi:hypothetical protein
MSQSKPEATASAEWKLEDVAKAIGEAFAAVDGEFCRQVRACACVYARACAGVRVRVRV